MKLRKSNEAKVDKVDMKINLLTARFGKMEEQVKNNIEEADSDEHKKKDHDWNELFDEFKQLREQVSAINLEQLLDGIKGLCERFDEFSPRLPSIDTSRTITPAEPSSELDRILRQMDETEKELHSVRKETIEINLLIEKTWQKDRSTDAIDHLKDKQSDELALALGLSYDTSEVVPEYINADKRSQLDLEGSGVDKENEELKLEAVEADTVQ
ncbi:hypothetical protein OSTOST_01970 [Ostertagia ostertagi]